MTLDFFQKKGEISKKRIFPRFCGIFRFLYVVNRRIIFSLRFFNTQLISDVMKAVFYNQF